ncbi:hypothetical protein CK203_032042 [Vitis vinifera]|uniref:Uncharacterized protein n=1 Tax=Vitis vinifera TaxID=29760 RepID=A0A438FN63_VITVI|nr:hypothetical protein CK203_076723 [Vitis vinifera]RVW61393.1 hypothetical protein CK203_032042 [Vitis vinifera]
MFNTVVTVAHSKPKSPFTRAKPINCTAFEFNFQIPGGLIEGIVDFGRMKAGYAPSHWVQPGQGDQRDQGYVETTRFLDYRNTLQNGFVAELRKEMRKITDQLWSECKAKYNNNA